MIWRIVTTSEPKAMEPRDLEIARPKADAVGQDGICGELPEPI